MKIKDMPYEHITKEEITEVFTSVIDKVKSAASVGDVLSAREEYLVFFRRLMSNMSLCEIRYTCNTADEFYSAENDYIDEVRPIIENLNTEYGKAILNSPFKAELEEKLSPVYLKYLEVASKAISPEILEDMVEENKITSEYSKLMAGLEFEFRGEKLSRASLAGYFMDDDRNTRREAYKVFGNEMNLHTAELDDIFDRLVKVRTRMARKMGYDNFIELGYHRMSRVCYGKDEVENFRRGISEYIVPLVSRLRLENAENLGIDRFMYYDNDVIIKGGDPKPHGTKEDIFNAARDMYHDMSEESGKFIDLMLENDAFDVDARKNKWGGGYCTEIPLYKQPFILANFNGSAGDVDVMTHEAGHAFNAYLVADNKFALEIGCGGMETAEVHSMSMEFFAWKYADKFFGDESEKYKYMHALGALSFLPYGTAVDEFQHIIYENPDMSPDERCKAWMDLEKKYRPYINVDTIPFIEDGRRWQYQMHIYESPFYYIDYCLAQTVAFGFLLSSLENYDDAYSRYINLMKCGGETYFTNLVTNAGLPSPFAANSLKELALGVEKLLSEIKV